MRVIETFDSLQGEGYWTGVPMTFVRLAGCNAASLGLDCVRWCDTPDSWDESAGEDMSVGEVVDRIRLPRLCLTGGEPLVQLEAVAALVSEAHLRGFRVHLETNGTIDPMMAVPAAARAGAGSARLLKGDASQPERDGYAREKDAGSVNSGAICATEDMLSRRSVRSGSRGFAFQQPPRTDQVIEFDWVVVSPKPPRYLISAAWDDRVDELKLVADDDLDVATAERLAADYPGAFVSIQPEFGDLPVSSAREWNRAGSASTRRAMALVLAHPDWRLSLQTHKLLGIR